AGQTTSTAAAQRTDSSQLERVALRGPALKIAENMQASLTVPTATSQRQIPIKLLEENRRLINQHLAARGRKISFTHLIVRAIVKAIDRFPNLNDTYEETNGTAYRVRHSGVNIGIAVDVTKKDGSRSLLVPNIKLANKLSFSELMNAYDDIVKRARDGKLQIEDFQGTTISLTNPGTIGTTASNPRLMNGQSIIVATGAMDYPPEYVAMSPEVTSRLGISKIMTLTSTYDHRIVHGAESGAFLALIDEMLRGKHQFYEQVFAELNILQRPYRWSVDRNPILEDRHRDETKKQASVLQLINSYRVRGHLLADLDPLGSKTRTYHPELDIETYGLTIWDLDREFICGGFGGKDVATLREIVEKLVKCYCGRSAIEYKHIESPEEKAWLAAIVEKELPTVPQEVKKQLLWKLISAEQFEKFLGTKYLGQKRFSIEGAETVVAMLDQLIESAADRGIDDITIGMAHRGRLNVLANVIGKFCERIFTIFEGSIHPSFPQDQHDVKYHQGATGERDTTGGSKIRVTVMPNPSHLEFIDPVVEGAVRAKQERLKQEDPSADIYKKLPVLAHGDAAFAGEGIVAETLNLSQLPGYSTGGTIHIIINNQLGFTTTPEEGRSSTYSTDVAKMVQAPIFHVNGDEPELVYQVLQTALDYRQKFHKDIVIDVIGFRRHGHNEGDEPTYTQPVMYKPIRLHPGIREIYSTRLIKEGILTNEELHSLIDERMRRYENAQLGAKETVARQGKDHILPDPLPEPDPELGLDTGVAQPILKEIGHAVNSVPRGFNLNPKIVGLLTRRAKMVEGEVAVDWGMAEALAFGSLLLEGTSVRLSGQDSVRGTFSQRHAGFYDSQTGDQWIPLSVLPEAKGTFCVYDSPLSEAGVLGFDYGYSVVWPESLVLWEAQFGDFVNAAQVIIDQFIAAGEEKWHQKCNLVMLLPHGYEGQGPEHSSGRVERFLQLCAGGNMFVVCATTASQYFHLLRRQIKKPINKPLIVMTPKSLLRMHEASSPISEFTTGEFRPVLPDTDITDNSRVKKALLCTGKVYYDLEIERRRIKDDTTAIIRVEQLYPFPKTLLAEQISLYNSNVEIRWVQEEPQNMGYWHYIEPRLRDLFKKEIKYIGRYPSSSTATGSHTIHHTEQKHLTEEAFK
ncbi:MAG: multifunctional oxoglutarate decarboxylase/oxoglutarate dehydrogenase thiamine pyrophosphate-binding subunit/dihydrolipoyllysine-residue succinyltransferase subunit, partial [Blastocatellia bacterium]|nr:multifunctional oxoglutarate decarboxylase/oxoglutarate dehydrogenase thiamine pyrophosphate-binding subunit/dihydrolipoyllysine-residue succinyltransferase subunit [Blastocatellia bacterium]